MSQYPISRLDLLDLVRFYLSQRKRNAAYVANAMDARRLAEACHKCEQLIGWLEDKASVLEMYRLLIERKQIILDVLPRPGSKLYLKKGHSHVLNVLRRIEERVNHRDTKTTYAYV